MLPLEKTDTPVVCVKGDTGRKLEGQYLRRRGRSNKGSVLYLTRKTSGSSRLRRALEASFQRVVRRPHYGSRPHSG